MSIAKSLQASKDYLQELSIIASLIAFATQGRIYDVKVNHDAEGFASKRVIVPCLFNEDNGAASNNTHDQGIQQFAFDNEDF